MPSITINIGHGADRQQLDRIEASLKKLENLLFAIATTEKEEAMTLAQLKVQVEKNTAIEESAVSLINGIAQQLKNAANDPAAIQALADELTQSGTDLAAAITANTPAAPSPTA